MSKRAGFYAGALALALVLATGSGALAQGKGPKSRPHGWDQGKKKGWEGGNRPPGLEKKGGGGGEGQSVIGVIREVLGEVDKATRKDDGPGRGRGKK